MIKTIHQLLTEIKNKGIEEIEPFLNIEHGPMIGDMYEGLTKEIVEKSLFDGMDLRVVSGKITNQVDGKLSSQIDCMVVIGDGTLVVEGLDEYCWIASYRRNPLILFLELLWTRLTYFYNLSTRIFGNELQEEALIPLLTAQGTEKGWLYRVRPYSERNRKPLDHDREWSPTVLSETENLC